MQGTHTVIEVKDIKKKFRVFFDKGYTLKEKAIGWKRNSYKEKWVLNGISFRIKKGEAVGIIGQNGCGKSTLLKLLTRIMYPDSGEVILHGRVSSLIELGAGFHPDLSGRENIYINASIFGLNKSEIEQRIDEIICFSELEESIDNPIRTYSSGMYMRLAFSVAIHVDADILLIDEILAVGDANFQEKCFEKMQEIQRAGVTIVIVSHSLGQIEKICNRTIWLQDGLLKAEGAPAVVHCQYLDYMARIREQVPIKEIPEAQPEAAVVFDSVFFMDVFGNERAFFDTAEDIFVVAECSVLKRVDKAVFSIKIVRSDGLYCYGGTSRCNEDIYFSLQKNTAVKVRMHKVFLLAGTYQVSIGIEDETGKSICYMDRACEFRIREKGGAEGAFFIQNTWEVINEPMDKENGWRI